MGLPDIRGRKGLINCCRTCGRVIPKRRKYCSIECRTLFAERLALLTVTLQKIKARYASLTVSPGVFELVVMPREGSHVSRFKSQFDPGQGWQAALFDFTLTLNERWHLLRRRLRSEKLASRELLDINRTVRYKKEQFDLDLSGPTSRTSRDVHRALNVLDIQAEELGVGDFVNTLKKRFSEKAHATHPDQGSGDTKEFMRVKEARDTLVGRWQAGDLEAILDGGELMKGNPMPWSFFFDGYEKRWIYPD